jgi:hypothetical protein
MPTTCFYHHSETITNFCTAPRCALPLCPQCIKTHLLEHHEEGSRPSIEYYHEAQLKARKETLARLEFLQRIASKHNPADLQRDVLAQLSQAKNSLIDQIQKKFELLEAEAKDAISRFNSRNLFGCSHSFK